MSKLQIGDIVRFKSEFLGKVHHIWSSTLALRSGQLILIEHPEEGCTWSFGRYVEPFDAEGVEFIAKGISPGAPVEELGMDHPWIMARMQARIDASFAREDGVRLKQALAMAESRANDLFGGAPQGWVATAVASVFANNAYEPPETTL